MIRTGLPTFRAQTAVTAASGIDRDSLPPNPPPIRFTRTVTLLAGIPRTLATTPCMGKYRCFQLPASFFVLHIHL
jgi:hypothetical protein